MMKVAKRLTAREAHGVLPEVFRVGTCFRIVAVSACLLASLCPAGAELDLPLLWTADLKTYTESGATAADINEDGLAEILVAGREEVIALGKDGHELWRWRTEGRFMTYPAVLQRPGPSALIYAADTAGLLTCLDNAGQVVWQARLDGPSSWSATVVCDLESDGTPEVVQTSERGTVTAFSALTGEVIWKAQVEGMPASPTVGDLDGNGRSEVVVVTGKGVTAAFGADGASLWERRIGGTSDTWATSAPVLFGASDGKTRVVAASNEGRVFCLDQGGGVLWNRPTRGPVAATISVGDVDLDGRADVFLITQLGVIYRFDEDGALVWDIDMQGRSLAAGAIVDVDGDGRLEYALCTQNGHLLVLNREGEFVFDWQFDNRTINVTPAFGDVTPDSPGLEIVITGGEAGLTFCFGTQAPIDTLAQWTAYRGDENKNGTWFGLTRDASIRMFPENLAWNRVCTGDSIQFVVLNPRPSGTPLTATAVCVRPDGARVAATSKVIGRRGVLSLPVDVVSPGTYGFTWSLDGADGKPLASGSRSVQLLPFANDRAIARRGSEALGGAADAVKAVLPLSAAALRNEAAQLERDTEAVVALHEAAPGAKVETAENMLQQSAALVAQARRALAVAAAVSSATALGSEASVVVSEGDLWENRAVDRRVPGRVANPLCVTRRVVPGEHEPVALDLFNIMDHPLHARVLLDAPVGGPAVTVHRSAEVPTSLGERSWDALPELDESSVVTIPPLETHEVWLDLDCGDVAPGVHQVTVRVLALNGAGVLEGTGSPRSISPPETVVEITVNVLPFAMAPSSAIRLCAWASLDGPSIEDLLAHGNNVFIGPHGLPQYDENGTLTGFDFSALDEFVRPFSGNDVMLLLSGIPGIKGQLGTPEYTEVLARYLEALVARLATHGFDTDHFALYPIDEPGGAGWNAVDQVVAFGKMVRQANPDLLIYVNGGGELPMFEAMAPYTDIWCPGITMLPESSPEMTFIRDTGKTIWSYDCGYAYARPVGANIKNINIVGQFRTAALFAFRYRATGIGFWCYNIGEDPWGRTQMEYSLVYPGRTRPVTSRRWEAVHEGIEDFRIVAALQARLDAGTDAMPAENARARIKQLLDVRLPEMIDQGFNETRLGLAREVLDASNNEVTINAFRREMMDCIEALTAGQ